mmetsp:Transcript_1648/g.1959  ORF Transcript_1648/g.1959 Transcript_1648/m.1959 type:complete len:109 (-) Transcript_1648:1098-1424(-)
MKKKAVCRIKFIGKQHSSDMRRFLLPELIDLKDVETEFLSVEDGCFQEIRQRTQDLSHGVFHPIWNSHTRDDELKHRVLLNFIGRELEDVLSPHISGMSDYNKFLFKY